MGKSDCISWPGFLYFVMFFPPLVISSVLIERNTKPFEQLQSTQSAEALKITGNKTYLCL